MSVSLGGSRRRRNQPVTRGDGIGKQFDGFRGYNVDRPGISVMAAAARGRIAQKCDVMASMRRIDRGCETCLFGDKAGDCEASDLRNDIVKELIGIAGGLRALEHHIGTFRLET
jgi:hypothetical protein